MYQVRVSGIQSRIEISGSAGNPGTTTDSDSRRKGRQSTGQSPTDQLRQVARDLVALVIETYNEKCSLCTREKLEEVRQIAGKKPPNLKD